MQDHLTRLAEGRRRQDLLRELVRADHFSGGARILRGAMIEPRRRALLEWRRQASHDEEHPNPEGDGNTNFGYQICNF